jgi:hypothetical protein
LSNEPGTGKVNVERILFLAKYSVCIAVLLKCKVPIRENTLAGTFIVFSFVSGSGHGGLAEIDTVYVYRGRVYLPLLSSFQFYTLHIFKGEHFIVNPLAN